MASVWIRPAGRQPLKKSAQDVDSAIARVGLSDPESDGPLGKR
jgi:hypothetical protein